MKRIEKTAEPVFWKDFRHKKKVRNYQDLDKTPEGRKIRGRLKHALLTEQKGICCYCCSEIKEEKSHNEHFLPQCSHPQESMNYNNIFCSCNTDSTCGTFKANSTVCIVSPTESNPESHFAYQQDGRILGLDSIGEDTIRVLNLNYRTLMEKRAACLKECFAMAKSCGKYSVNEHYIQPDKSDGMLPRFPDMVSYFMNIGLFDDDVIQSSSSPPARPSSAEAPSGSTQRIP